MRMRNVIQYAILIAVMIFQSCGGATQIPVPRDTKDGLVVIPHLVIDPRKAPKPIIYALHISLEEVATHKEKTIIVSELTNDYLFTRELVPGKYLITGVVSRYGAIFNRTFARFLEVEAGKITVFPYKFVIVTDKEGNYYQIHEIRKEDMEKIVTVLKKDSNFNSWSINLN